MTVNLVENSLRFSNGKRLTGNIYLRWEDVSFPEEDWNDFVDVVLLWWWDALVGLKEGAGGCELRFMDGPFWVRMTKVTDVACEMEFVDGRKPANNMRTFEADADELRQSLKRSIQKLLRHAAKSGWETSELDSLRERLGEAADGVS